MRITARLKKVLAQDALVAQLSASVEAEFVGLLVTGAGDRPISRQLCKDNEALIRERKALYSMLRRALLAIDAQGGVGVLGGVDERAKVLLEEAIVRDKWRDVSRKRSVKERAARDAARWREYVLTHKDGWKKVTTQEEWDAEVAAAKEARRVARYKRRKKAERAARRAGKVKNVQKLILATQLTRNDDEAES